MPKKKELYECEKCGKAFTDWAECDTHENNDHTVMLPWTEFKPKYSYISSMYPDSIEVPFLDGAIVRYKIDSIVQDPDKKEAPVKEGQK